MRILPQEVQLFSVRPYLSVRTKVPKEELEDGEKLAQYARVRGAQAGDHIIVQVMDETGEELLSEGDFVVTRMRAAQRQIEDGNTFRNITQIDCKVVRFGEWWDAPGVIEEVEPESPAPPTQYATSSDWKAEHAGFGKWRVVDGSGAVIASGLDKETAQDVALGNLPVPQEEAA